jgi:hypothetical protein
MISVQIHMKQKWESSRLDYVPEVSQIEPGEAFRETAFHPLLFAGGSYEFCQEINKESQGCAKVFYGILAALWMKKSLSLKARLLFLKQ